MDNRGNDPLVNILISTYNGKRYIRQQIDSILSQTYTNYNIYIRDDGSTDGTIDILRQYEKNGAVELIIGDNIGYGRSFLTLLNIASEGEYWAFCDQDDVWVKDKLQHSIEILENISSLKPRYYTHAYLVTDEKLTPSYTFDNSSKDFCFRTAIAQNIPK